MPSRDDAPGEEIIDPMDTFFDTDFGNLPVTPEGQFIPAATTEFGSKIPDANEETFICLRGPCRHYLEQIPYFDAGNAEGSLDHNPVMFKRTCMRITGYEIDLTDMVMFDCNSWDPSSPYEVEALEQRRFDNYWSQPGKQSIKDSWEKVKLTIFGGKKNG